MLGPDSGAPGAQIVLEAKAEQGITLAKALEEMSRAWQNRQVYVHTHLIKTFDTHTLCAGADWHFRMLQTHQLEFRC